jgi:hypothetical protein
VRVADSFKGLGFGELGFGGLGKEGLGKALLAMNCCAWRESGAPKMMIKKAAPSVRPVRLSWEGLQRGIQIRRVFSKIDSVCGVIRENWFLFEQRQD